MASLSLAEQQINVISQLQEFCIAALKQRCSVTRTERLNGLLLRIHNFFASNPQVSQLTQIQQNDLSNLWNLLKRRLPELGLDEDDNHRELLQSIKDIEKIIDHERDTIKSVVTGDDEVDLAVKRGLFG